MLSTFVRNLYLLSIFVALTFSPLLAEIGGRGKFWFAVDYSRFWGNDTLTYMELYYSVPEDILSYQPAKERFIGGMNIFVLVSENGNVVAKRDWTMPHSLQDTSQLSRKQNIVGLTSFALPKGEYLVEIRAHDFYNPQRADTVRLPVHIKGFPSTGSSLSDLEICTSIRQIEADSENIFYKNTLEVLPNVGGLFGIAVPTLFYYVEAYNLTLLPSSSYDIGILVYDATGKEVVRHEKTKRRINNSSVEIGTLNVHQLRGGTYTMVLHLTDSAKTKVLSSSRKFFVYKPGTGTETQPVSSSEDFAGSEFAVMQEAELDADFAQARYIANATEANQFKKFSSITDEKTRLDTKRNFLFNFWKARDSDGAGGGNPFRQEYRRRIQEANEKFSGGYKQGWQTERGRVYVVYGAPDAVERIASSSETIPYEMWTYNQIQGGVLFVFIDRTGFGDWYLVHSTHRNELHDDNWMNYLRK